MNIVEIVRLFLGTAFIIGGLIIFIIEIIGLFKFKYVLDRMHAGAMGDTLGLVLCMTGLCIFSGINFTTAKILLTIVFFWCASPVTSHMTALLELYTNPRLRKHLAYEGDLETLEKKLKKEKNEQ